MVDARRVLPLVLVSACVFPADEPTGVELSWRFVEVNMVDGEDAIRVRTCAGAGYQRVVFDITQVRAEERSGNFDYACEVGYQTPAEFRTEASDAFIELRPADYMVVVDGRGIGGTQRLRELELDVVPRGLTVEGLDLALPAVPWSLLLSGTDACGEVSFALRYREPAESLAEPAVDEEGEPIDVAYREALASIRGLPLAGTPVPCSADLAGAHVVENVDQGVYRLEIVRDGAACSVDVDISPGDSTSVIDLANLECGG